MTTNSNALVGGHFWTPFGDKRWSAVTVIAVDGDMAVAHRADPVTNEQKTRVTTISVSSLVKRDPELKGVDKPTAGYTEPPSIKRQPAGKAEDQELQKKLTALFDLLEDKSTIDDWIGNGSMSLTRRRRTSFDN